LSIFTLRTLHEYIDLIILQNLLLIPFFRSLYNNAEWMTESNAFLRSTKQAYIFPDFCMYLQINVFNLKIWSADSVIHSALLYKLLKNGINGKFFNIIKSIYSCSVLRVKMDNNLSNCFKSEIGVKQGDNLGRPYLIMIGCSGLFSEANLFIIKYFIFP
jgi:hypothetical protein